MAGDSEPAKKPPLSCTSCRARKLKCNKQDPCSNCERSGSECVFPARKRIQRPRKTKNAELLQRLKRLESIVGKVGLGDLEGIEAAQTEEATDAQDTEPQLDPTAATDPRPHGENVTCGIKGVRPPQDSTALRYLSGEFWSSLCDEVGGLRQALEQSTDSDDEDDGGGEGTTPESVASGGSGIPTTPGMLLGAPQGTRALPFIVHPLPNHIRYLASVYFRNVDMYLKILHRPTILRALHSLANNPEIALDLSPEHTALSFAIYYAAITSLTSSECVQAIGRPRADLASLFEAGIEKALVSADYLNNTSLETLQALTLYACCLRSHNGSRASWALLGLPIRLAQALNLHQDGDGSNSGFSPFEAELRRRLWWQLIVLDIRAAEDRGTNTVIARGSYDTRLPHNIDDEEFGPDTTAPLQDRPGPSDTTFSLLTAQSSGIFLWAEHAHKEIPSERETLHRVKHLESQFVNGANPEHAGSYLASVTARLIILKMWLLVRYPVHPRDGNTSATGRNKASSSHSGIPDVARPSQPNPDISSSTENLTSAASVSRESTLRTALSIMELSESLATGPYSDRFRWWTETYVQWHPLAVALAELCTQTHGGIVEHAWRIIESVFPKWSDIIADTKRGSLWRPLRKLYKKAKAARKAALANTGHVRSQAETQAQTQSTWGPGAPTTSAQSYSLESTTDYMALDPALTSIESLRPRLITDMVISESSAHTLGGSAPPPTYAPIGTMDTTATAATNLGTTIHQDSRGDMQQTGMGPSSRSFNYDAMDSEQQGQSIVHALMGWPDLGFDMPPAASATGEPVAVPPQVQTPGLTGNADGGTVIDPALPGLSEMDWTTWDEFVLDTYADSTPKSGSWGSEGS